MSPLSSDVLNVRDIFASATDLRVPPYQRGFSWGDKEISDLLKDFIDAFEHSVIYFVGAIVVIQPRLRGPGDVVDGQQRLTALTIMLAVLRDLSPSSDEASMLQGILAEQGMWDKPKWRMQQNHHDLAFFRDHIQRKGGALDLDGMHEAAHESGSESQILLADAVRQIHDELADTTEAWRTRFAKWLTEQVYIVKVRVTDHTLGYKVFLVLNHRGKPLSDHDILKSVLFQRASFTDKESVELSAQWNEQASRIGSSEFEALLKQVRFLYDRQMKGEFVEGLVHSILPKMSVLVFITSVLPRFVDAYEAVVNGKFDKIRVGPEAERSLCFLRAIHHESWRAPALKYLVEHRHNEKEAARFFGGLERLAYMLQYSAKERDFRHRRYRRLLDEMERGEIFQTGSSLNLDAEDKLKLKERLMGKFSNFKQRRALVLRLNAAVPGGKPLPPEVDATLEHILPRTPARTSKWREHWPKNNEIEELTETLGNFTLLPDMLNQKADRAEFEAKMAIYFRNGGEPDFAISNDLKGLTKWTPEDVRKRRERLVGYLLKEWEL